MLTQCEREEDVMTILPSKLLLQRTVAASSSSSRKQLCHCNECHSSNKHGVLGLQGIVYILRAIEVLLFAKDGEFRRNLCDRTAHVFFFFLYIIRVAGINIHAYDLESVRALFHLRKSPQRHMCTASNSHVRISYKYSCVRLGRLRIRTGSVPS